MLFAGLFLLACPLLKGMERVIQDQDACDEMLVEHFGHMQLFQERASNRTELSLKDLVDCMIIDKKVLEYECELRALILDLVVTRQGVFLEVILNALRKFKENLNYSIIAHDALVATVSRLVQIKSQDCVERYFQALPECSLKMTIRFVYAIKYKKNLDQYDCMLCPKRPSSYLFVRMIRTATNEHWCSVSWHFDFSNNSLCNETMMPVVFSLLQPILNRIYPDTDRAYSPIALFGSIDISGNEYDASPWLYLLPKQVVPKVVNRNERVCWGPGPITMTEESTIVSALFDAFV